MRTNQRTVLQQRYGQLAVVREVEPQGTQRHRAVETRCDCGTVKVVRLAHLVSGRIISCGCAALAKNTTHGHAAGGRTPEYNAWVSMVQRCENPKNPRYADYGGRGISVCQAWRDSYDTFIADMGPRPSENHSIDRIDNDGNYEPSNCRWATRSEQQRNQRTRRSTR